MNDGNNGVSGGGVPTFDMGSAAGGPSAALVAEFDEALQIVGARRDELGDAIADADKSNALVTSCVAAAHKVLDLASKVIELRGAAHATASGAAIDALPSRAIARNALTHLVQASLTGGAVNPASIGAMVAESFRASGLGA